MYLTIMCMKQDWPTLCLSLACSSGHELQCDILAHQKLWACYFLLDIFGAMNFIFQYKMGFVIREMNSQ